MTWKIVSRASWVALLAATIFLAKKWDDSRKETEILNDRLKRVEAQAAAYEASTAEQSMAQAEIDSLKNALIAKNGEIEQLQEQASQVREQVLEKSAEDRALLTTGVAKAMSRFGLSGKELETLLADLPAEDRVRVLEQVAAAPQAASSETEQPPSTEPGPTTPPAVEMPAEQAPLVPNTDPADRPAPVAAESKTEEAPATRQAKESAPTTSVSYTVKRGDNLTQIGRKFDVEVAQLMKFNGIADANKLRVGQVLKIPQN
ncbi:LysM peptidoglycan-binding domain-containing protein [Haloferula chungangensis]|uniref:LysM peptidoglycan-binding domain-containing protein n=1 Tax=Haloferula chungangensis TaxID=1048331 RepID=A0ABW2L6Q0_9BACT